MERTRTRRAGLMGNANKHREATNVSVSVGQNDHPVSAPDIDGDDASETIGARLRKRRRTSVNRGTSSTPKGPSPVKTASTSRKRATAVRGSLENLTPRHVVSQPDSQSLHREDATEKNAPIPQYSQRVPDSDVNGAPEERPDNEQPSTPDAAYQDQSGAVSTDTDCDLNSAFLDILKHYEVIQQCYNRQGYVDTESFVPLGANHHLKTQSLPILDNLAKQVLNVFAKSTYHEILTMITDPESELGKAYGELKSLFDHVKKIYSSRDPFLSPYALELMEPAHADTIRKANMATFVSSVFGSQDVGFYYLNEYYLDTFVPDGSRLLKSQAQLFLDLKTHAYISASTNGYRSRAEILDDLFPPDLGERLLNRRPGAKQLAPSELDFLRRAENRHKALLEDAWSEEAVAALPKKYVWEHYLRDISAYVNKNFDTLVDRSVRKNTRSDHSLGHSGPNQGHQLQHQSSQSQPLSEFVQSPVRSGSLPDNPPVAQMSSTMDTDDIAEKAARAAQFAIQGFDMNQAATSPPHQSHLHAQTLPQAQFHSQPNMTGYYHESPFRSDHQIPHPTVERDVNGDSQTQFYPDQEPIPYPTQMAPTQVLYERARTAATSKASPSSRRSGHPSQRRAWTAEEESALLAGLDRVKGPHWSQILALFGPGGKINETLKDRNQVQLKDKARNIKLFFQKNNQEVPYYLSFVTGELKTRAPAQAAKNEARRSTQERAAAKAALQAGSQTVETTENELDENVSGEVEDKLYDNDNQMDAEELNDTEPIMRGANGDLDGHTAVEEQQQHHLVDQVHMNGHFDYQNGVHTTSQQHDLAIDAAGDSSGAAVVAT